MRSLFQSLLGYFLTPGGLIVMGALDSSLIFFLPLGIDFAVIALAARKPDLFWLYAILAAAGSLAGAVLTFWIGSKVGDHGLTRLIKPSRLERVRRRVSDHAAAGVAGLGLIPPPFPFTAFVLVAGALNLNRWSFFTTLGAVRLARFAAEAGLAAIYGRRILAWMESTTFQAIVGTLIVLAVGGTIVSGVAFYRGARHRDRGPAPLRS